MKRNISEREDFEEIKKITLDFENVLVQSVDGLIIGGDNEEIKLLFYYLRPESYINEDGVAEAKGVAELRVSSSKFMDIASEINEKIKDIKMESGEMVMFG